MGSQLTIYFDGQFWVAVFELRDAELLRSARHVFGPEPTDPEVLEWVRSRSFLEFLRTVECSLAIIDEPTGSAGKAPNPKRAARIVRKAMSGVGVSSKADEAMRLTQEANKKERKLTTSSERDAAQASKFEMRNERAKQKRRGR
jgi:Protein of unknown function (DUF2992)